jgi:hypothetical protein
MGFRGIAAVSRYVSVLAGLDVFGGQLLAGFWCELTGSKADG